MKLPWNRPPIDEEELARQTLATLDTTQPQWSGYGDVIGSGEVSCEVNGSPVRIVWGYQQDPAKVEWTTLEFKAAGHTHSVKLKSADASQARLVGHRALRTIASQPR